LTHLDKIMEPEIELVNEALGEYLNMRIESVSHLGDTHTLYYNNIKEYMMRGGKRLRPILVITAFKSIRERVDLEYLYRAACSVELLHNGSLLHDDLIDHDETRRGGPTFHALYREWFRDKIVPDADKAVDFGMTMAILGGDSLLNMGAEIISDSHLPAEKAFSCLRYYQLAYKELAEGVLLEMNMVFNPKATPEQYMEMIKLKTAVLFEKSLLMGGALAGATESQLNALSEFGIKVGQAFQIQDDILGSFGDEDITGKSVDGDIREGKRTMLLLETMHRADANQLKRLKGLLKKEPMSSDDVEDVRVLFRETGALEECKKRMHELLDSGQDSLRKATPKLREPYLSFLIELSDFLIKRDY
jgi:geranylgeranyl pyrophosphate synthase